jgi:hypothetical protein
VSGDVRRGVEREGNGREEREIRREEEIHGENYISHCTSSLITAMKSPLGHD